MLYTTSILKVAVSALLSLSFQDGSVPGVEGQAMLFDGFDSKVVLSSAEVPAPDADFTIDLWLCPLSFPKSPMVGTYGLTVLAKCILP